MFSENRALVWLSENRDLVLGETCSGSRRNVLWFLENCALALGENAHMEMYVAENGPILVQVLSYCILPILPYPCSG